MLVLPVCRWLRPICRSRLTSRGAWELAAPGSWAPRLSSAMKKRSFSHSLDSLQFTSRVVAKNFHILSEQIASIVV